MSKAMWEDITLSNILTDICCSDVNDLPKKYCIIYVALEEFFNKFENGDENVKDVLNKEGRTAYCAKLHILQTILTNYEDESCKQINSFFSWLMKNISNNDFVDKIWDVITKKGSVIRAVKSYKNLETNEINHTINED